MVPFLGLRLNAATFKWVYIQAGTVGVMQAVTTLGCCAGRGVLLPRLDMLSQMLSQLLLPYNGQHDKGCFRNCLLSLTRLLEVSNSVVCMQPGYGSCSNAFPSLHGHSSKWR